MILFEEFDNSVNGANDLIILEACGLKSLFYWFLHFIAGRKNCSAKKFKDALVADTSFKNFTGFVELHILILMILFNMRL